MRAKSLIALSGLALLVAGSVAAEAQPLRLNVRPRSFLDPGNTVAPYSGVNPASGAGQTVAYMVNPPWNNQRDRFGEGTLPDPIGGAFIGATNILGPVDYEAPFE